MGAMISLLAIFISSNFNNFYNRVGIVVFIFAGIKFNSKTFNDYFEEFQKIHIKHDICMEKYINIINCLHSSLIMINVTKLKVNINSAFHHLIKRIRFEKKVKEESQAILNIFDCLDEEIQKIYDEHLRGNKDFLMFVKSFSFETIYDQIDEDLSQHKVNGKRKVFLANCFS